MRRWRPALQSSDPQDASEETGCYDTTYFLDFFNNFWTTCANFEIADSWWLPGRVDCPLNLDVLCVCIMVLYRNNNCYICCIIMPVCAVYKVSTKEKGSERYPRKYLKEWERHPQFSRNTWFSVCYSDFLYFLQPLDYVDCAIIINNNNNNLIYIAPACRMTSEALADSSSHATECLTEK